MVEIKSHLAWVVWGLAAAYFFSDYFARVSPGVMGRELQLAFNTSAAGLGLLSSFFYYPYVLMQIPVGLMVDRYSVRLLLTIMALVTGLGCMLFAVASAFWIAAVGRMLIGFSAAFAFVSALRLAAVWFPPEKLGLLAGLTQALGMWGAAVGEAPVSFLVTSIGWRQTLWLMSAVFLALSVLIFLFVRDKPSHHRLSRERQVKPKQSILKSLRMILGNYQTWIAAIYVGMLFAPIAIIGEFWGATYLRYGRGFSEHFAAFADGLIFIGWGFGGPLAGFISDKLGQRRSIMIVSALVSFLIVLLLFFIPSLSQRTILVLFFALGFANCGLGVGYALATEINCRSVIGVSIAFANMSSVIIGAILQPIFGRLIELAVGYRVTDIATLTLKDFHLAIFIIPMCSFFALVAAFLVKETHAKPKA